MEKQDNDKNELIMKVTNLNEEKLRLEKQINN